MQENPTITGDDIIKAINQEAEQFLEVDLTDYSDCSSSEASTRDSVFKDEEIVFDFSEEGDLQAVNEKTNNTDVIKLENEQPSNSEVKAPQKTKQRYQSVGFVKLDENNIQEIIKHCRIDPDNSPPEPIVSLERVEPVGNNSKVLMKGGITTITGKPKSCKTKLCAMLAAACLDQSVYSGLFESYLCESDDQIIYIDTEQSRHDVAVLYHTIQRILKSQKPLDSLYMYSLRHRGYRDRLRLLEGIVSDPNAQIGIMFIDGVRDLVSDPNNADEANTVVSMLMRWSVELNISIVIVIHQNKVDSNVRGHLGSEIVNKSDTVISTERSGDICEVKTIVSRGKNITPFYFKLKEDGTPYVTDAVTMNETKTVNQDSGSDVTPESVAIGIHQEVLRSVYAAFDRGFIPGWTDLIKALQKGFANRSVNVGENKLRAFISFYLRKEMLFKTSVPGRSYGGYQIHKA